MRLLWLPLVLAACPGPEETDTDVDSGSDVDTDRDTDTEVTATMSGTVHDADGNGIEGARVNMCRSLCYTTATDAAGAYSLSIPPETYSLHVEPLVDGLSDPQVPHTLLDDATLDIAVPAVGTEYQLTSNRIEREIAPGLFVAAQLGDLTILFEDDPTSMSGVRVDEGDRLPIDDLSGDVVAMWYLEPWSADCDPGIPVRVSNFFGATLGSTYELWQASYDGFGWVKVGDLTEDGGFLQGGLTLTKIETLALVAPSSR